MKRIALALVFVGMVAAAACGGGDQRGASDTTMADTTHQMTDSMQAMPDTTP
ncbi:MAG: hypothetical protein Q8Q14_10445 [Gemmatimonadales bacterium]|nr:hypothetical protein [Gemmatimonadales bacterium]